MVKRGGRRDIFLGTRECQAFVEPCVFGEDKSYYDTMPGEVGYGFMYHGITYAEEAILEEDKDQMTVRFWRPVMKKGGIIEFTRPEECTEKRHIRYVRSRQIRPTMRFRCIPWRDRRASETFGILRNGIWKKHRYLMRRSLRMK